MSANMILRTGFYGVLGLGILFANKIRYFIRGYRTPRPFAVTDTGKVIAYDTEVVERFQKHLSILGVPHGFAGKDVLELGPGADLGVALLLLEQGAKSYKAIDVNKLITQADPALYEHFFARMEKGTADELRRELQAFFSGQPSRIKFVHDPAFSFKGISSGSIDLVVSNAAFEHFVDVPEVLRQVDRVTRSGGHICAHVDLQTHTKVIRDRDPLNIYRYPVWLYKAMKFSGIPNRVRPSVYLETMKKLGWQDARVIPVTEIAKADLETFAHGVRKEYTSEGDELRTLSFMLLARKP